MPSPAPPEPWALPELTRARRAIVVVDVVESVRLMQEDEAGFIERWRRFVHQVRSEVLPAHGGRMVKSLGDGMLLEFAAVREAVAAALAMQRRMREAAPTLRIGIHADDVVIDELDIYGSGVNLTARLAALGSPGDITVSVAVRDEIVDGLHAAVEDLGACWLKHLAEPVHAFRITSGDAAGVPPLAAEAPAVGVAVVPLHCVAGAAADALLGDFVADALIGGLTLAPELRVPSRLSTRALATYALDAVETGRRLHVAYVVSGSHAVIGDRVVIDIELADARTGLVAWAHRVACATQALFEHPSEPLDALVAALYRAILDTEARRALSRPLPSLESYSLLVGSIGLVHRTARVDFDRAQGLLEALIERLPRHAAGYAWLAKWHLLHMIRGLTATPQRSRDEARRCVEQSIERDRHQSAAWALKGLVHAFGGHDLAKAEQCYVQALSENPSEPLAWLYQGTLHSWRGEGAQAGAAARRALALTPLDPMRYYYESLAAAALLSEGRLDDAIGLARSSLRVHRDHTPTYRVLCIAQMLAGRPDEARQTMQAMREREPGLTAADYLARYPGRDSPHAALYAQALREAGLPG